MPCALFASGPKIFALEQMDWAHPSADQLSQAAYCASPRYGLGLDPNPPGGCCPIYIYPMRATLHGLMDSVSAPWLDGSSTLRLAHTSGNRCVDTKTLSSPAPEASQEKNNYMLSVAEGFVQILALCPN